MYEINIVIPAELAVKNLDATTSDDKLINVCRGNDD